MSFLKSSPTVRSEDIMDDDSDDRDSKRKSRNLSEKKRRDQFNLLVNELSSMVSSGSRKMDKSTVLKATIAFLKNHNEETVRSRVHEIQEDWKPTFLSNEEFSHLVMEAVDGFIIVFSTSGQIFYTSEGITSLLGYLPSDVLGMSIYELASEEEQNELYSILLRGPSNEEKGQVSFQCHIRRGNSQGNNTMCYELVHFDGYFRSESELELNKERSKDKYSFIDSNEVPTNLLFVGTVRILTPQLIREMPLVESMKREFTSRHSLEWKFLFLDHRAPPIIGYLPFELLGTSGYDYYHVDDLERIIDCHDALMKKGEGTSCYYRFLTKGQQWIWLQTRFYITYHQWNSKPEFVVCTHRLVNYNDVTKKTVKSDESVDIFGESSSIPRSLRSRIEQPSSDCTSMSADSPTSRHSVMTQFSIKSKTSAKTPVNAPSQSGQTIGPQFMEPPQYLAAIPVQPVIASIQAPTTVLTTIVTPQAQDLQRKHAELEALIGQQQAELRRVSEQLLMARLGILQNNENTGTSVSLQYNTAGTVSSTTSQGQELPSVVMPAAPVPVTTIPLNQINQRYKSADK